MQSTEDRVKGLLSQMSLDEKIAQPGSYWIFNLQTRGQMVWAKTAERLKYGIGQITRLAGASTLDPVSTARTASRIQKPHVEQTRLGIPAILHEECCSGALLLEAGETKRVTFHLRADQLAFYDLDLNLIVEPGPIEVMVGSSSEDIRLSGKFDILGDRAVPVRERVFECPVSVT